MNGVKPVLDSAAAVIDAPAALLAWRGDRNQLEAAKLIGCNRSAISLWESRKRTPDREMSQRIERATGIPVSAWGEVPHVAPSVGQPVTNVNGAKTVRTRATAATKRQQKASRKSRRGRS